MSHIPKLVVHSLSPEAREYLRKHSGLRLDDPESWTSEDVFQAAATREDVLQDPVFIDEFKNKHLSPSQGKATRVFRSSGTTSTSKSHSPFSERGMELYRFEAVLTFWAAREAWGVSSDAQIISLVPPCEVWRESSLAQMVSWWGDFFHVKYVDVETDEVLQLADPEFVNGNIIIGTAFHFVHLLDSGLDCNWSDALVLETGGTKGRSRELSREDFYHELFQSFHIPLHRITTEYGMSELAAQAYELELHKPVHQRSLQFPRWVQLSVESDFHSFSPEGTGSLCIRDPLRADFTRGICTQDVASLRDTHFQLLGRSQGADLKGCSMNAEEILAPLQNAKEGTRSVSMRTPPRIRDDEYQDFQERLVLFFQSPEFLYAVSQELGSAYLAKTICDDLITCVPRSPMEWAQAIDTACGDAYPSKWYLILPQSHAISAIYPLVFMSLAQIDVSVRPGKNPAQQKTLDCIISFLRDSCSAQIEVLDTTVKFSGPPNPSGAMMIFGESSTVGLLAEVTGMPTVGFGSTLTLSAIQDLEDWDLASRDFFALRQRGCLSARALVLLHQESRPFDEIAKDLDSKSFLELSAKEQAGLHFERRRLSSLGYEVYQGAKQKNIWINGKANLEELSRFLSGVPFSIPVFQFSNFKSFQDSLIQLSSKNTSTQFMLSGLSIKGDLPANLMTCPFGQTQRQKWNGCHLNHPLFQTIMSP